VRVPRLLDAFCGAGGASVGYARAGFDATGVDHCLMPRYPYEFHQADALEFIREHGHEFDVIHASPVCKGYSRLSALHRDREYPMLIPETRDALAATGRPYVIENVEDAAASMRSPVKLCGSMFGLDVRRHRLFESNLLLFSRSCQHWRQTPRFPSLRQGAGPASVVGVYGHLDYAGELAVRQAAMGISWMSAEELSQAIPPDYTEHIGRMLMLHLAGEGAS